MGRVAKEAQLAGKKPMSFLRLGVGMSLGALLLMPSAVPAQGLPGIAGPYLAAESAERRGDIEAAARLYAETLARDTENVDLMDRTVTNQMAAGEIARAIPVARRLVLKHPTHHLGVLLMAADALKRGDPAEASKALETDAPNGGPFVGQLIDAWARFESGDEAGAIETLSGLETSGIGGPAGEIVAAYHLGLVHAAAGEDAQALEALDRAASKAGDGTLRLARIKAGVLARLDRVDDARATLKDRLALILGDKRLEALDRDLAAGRIPPPVVRTALNGAAEALFGVSGFLARSSNQKIALAYSQLAIYLDPDLVEARLLIADILRQEGQYDLAIAAFGAIPADAPEALDAQIGRAEALQAAERTDEGIAVLREAVLAHPRSLEAFTALGDMLRRDSRFAEAAEAYNGAIGMIDTAEKRHWPLYYQRGISFERSKQWDKAEADFQKALELEPDQPLVLNYLGYSWVEMGRNFDKAQRMIEKAVEQRPDDGYIVDSLGWVLYRLGDFEGAREHLEKAVELKPVDPVINDHFGDVLWMVGRRFEARFQWKRSLSFDPEEKDAVRIRRKLAVGLDKVLAEEGTGGAAAVIQQGATTTSGNGG